MTRKRLEARPASSGKRWLIPVALVLACAAPSPRRGILLHVSNDLGRDIVEIRQKPCHDLDLSFVPIEGSHLSPGETRAIVLPESCIDLVAYDSRGRIVGEQRGLEMLPGSTWVLKR
ncbi:MAG TPA: hypothetical protein ENI85_16270 [Deltaproteobacteria bacterium]|nr:hypothetical protein [Deltaproteobacteria bacterium]